MKRIVLFLTAAIFLMAGGLQAKDWKTIRMCSEGAYPPFNYMTPEGKLVGFDIEIGQALCDFLKVECTWQTQDWDGTIPGLLARKYDASIAQMSITEERLKSVAFSKKYSNSPAKLAAQENLVISVLSGEQKKIKIGVQRETIHDRYATAMWGKNTEIIRYGTQDEVYLDMKSGRIDLTLADAVSLSEGFLNLEGNEKFQFVGPTFSDPKWFGIGTGIAIHKDNQDLVELFNKAIDGIRANGTYKKIQDKYFNFDIYGD
ncbi:transporter substrate-binding domain-containing protein [bacterium]|nr:transporter substrate-binding domain-containing protein [bacterium]